ncbi:MAG: hypothetical protein ACTHU0_15410 [Kofleriaceae bacterium]
MTAPNFPALSDGEHAVVQLDPSTGVLLDANVNWALQGAHYDVFPTRAEAEHFADARQAEKPYSEWWIFDRSQEAAARRFAVGSMPLGARR